MLHTCAEHLSFSAMECKEEICDCFHFRPDTTFLVCGPSGSRKTSTVTSIVENWEEATNYKSKIKDVHIWQVIAKGLKT